MWGRTCPRWWRKSAPSRSAGEAILPSARMTGARVGPRPGGHRQSVIGRTSATDQIRPYTVTSCCDGEQDSERFADGRSGGELESPEVALFASSMPSLPSPLCCPDGPAPATALSAASSTLVRPAQGLSSCFARYACSDSAHRCPVYPPPHSNRDSVVVLGSTSSLARDGAGHARPPLWRTEGSGPHLHQRPLQTRPRHQGRDGRLPRLSLSSA